MSAGFASPLGVKNRFDISTAGFPSYVVRMVQSCIQSPTDLLNRSCTSAMALMTPSKSLPPRPVSVRLWHAYRGPRPVGLWRGDVRATVVRRDAERNAVLAGDPKKIRLLCNTTLITDIPSRGSKEERIRICLHWQVWANIRNNGYKR